jgi:hypothetical protein
LRTWGIFISRSKFKERWFDHPGYDLPYPEPAYQKYMFETYERVIKRMTCLKGLKSLFVHLNWSTSYTGEQGRAEGKWDGREALEERLEKMIMGSEYGAWSLGKTGFRDPQYLE